MILFNKLSSCRRFIAYATRHCFNQSAIKLSNVSLLQHNQWLNEVCNPLHQGNVRHSTTMLSIIYPFFKVRSRKKEKMKIYPERIRDKIISPETSIRYMDSKAYETTYGNDPVWLKYRRNYKGQFAPKLTRPTCIEEGYVTSGNPCPICRDEYLVLHHTNVKLLKQFISPYTGETFSAFKTCICQEQHFTLEVEIEKAKYYGYITFDVPFREYDYADFYPQLKNSGQKENAEH